MHSEQDAAESTESGVGRLIRKIERAPFEGVGKPEPLRYDLAGFWSRRVTDEHRFVCAVEDDQVLIAQGRYHY